jgi:hypothetical protein
MCDAADRASACERKMIIDQMSQAALEPTANIPNQNIMVTHSDSAVNTRGLGNQKLVWLEAKTSTLEACAPQSKISRRKVRVLA